MSFTFETGNKGFEQQDSRKKTPEKGADILDPKKGAEKLAAAQKRVEQGVSADAFLDASLKGVDSAEAKKDLVSLFLERVDSLAKDYGSMNRVVGGKNIEMSFAALKIDGQKVDDKKMDEFKSDLKKSGNEGSLDKVTMEFHIDKIYNENGATERVDNTVPVNATALLAAEAAGGVEAGQRLIFNNYEGALATFDKNNKKSESSESTNS